MISGVYRIVNKLDGKFYVGSAVKVRVRLEQHRRALVRGDHPNRYLLNAWQKHGADAFSFEPLEYVARDFLISVEQSWIDRHWDKGVLYNLRPTADSQLGMRWSPEVKARMQAAQRNRSPEWLRRMSEAKKGKTPTWWHPGFKRSEEFRKKIAESHKTRGPQSSETRAKRSAALKARWAASKALGIGLASKEACAKRSAANKETWAAGRRADQRTASVIS